MGDALARFVFAGTASLAVLTGTVRGVRAQEPCARLVAPPDLGPRWLEAMQELTRELAELPPAQCRPMTLVVEPVDGAVRLTAQAQDGQRAARMVAQPSLLVPVALGLVVSGAPDAAAEEEPTPPPPANAVPPARSAEVSAPSSPSRPVPPSAVGANPHPVAIWLGIAMGARIGVPSTISMVDVEGRLDLRVDPLLLFVLFRNVPVGFVAGQGFDGDAYHESSIAFGVGRSFPFGRSVFDVSIAPSLVTMRLSKDVPTHARANDVELRVGASARLNVPLSPNWRLTLALDTDVIPDFLRSEERIDPLPAFPSWTTGLCLGVSGAVL
jgi:hypothetical protein